MKRFLALASSCALIGALFGASAPSPASAWDLEAHTFEFIGQFGDCGLNYPPGSNIVDAIWLDGIGLPDDGGGNTTNTINPTNPGNKLDPHQGLLLSKNGPTNDCSAAGAEITGVAGFRVDPGFYLGFDYRNGGHCGGGSPRFNVSWHDNNGTPFFSFVGNCYTPIAARSQAVQDPLQWTTVRWTLTDSAHAQSGPCVPANNLPAPCATVATCPCYLDAITLIYDEGTDTTSADEVPDGVGASFVDNININGTIIRAHP